MLLEKYKPECSKDIVGQQEIINSLNHFLKRWKKGKLAIVYGTCGTGKTSLVKSIANEMKLDIFEVNPDNQSLETLRTAAKQSPLFKKGRIILFDDIDNFDSEKINQIHLISKESVFPVIFTATDPYDMKLRNLRKSCELMKLKRIPARLVENKLKEISEKEKLKIDEKALKNIARNSCGDLRSAINDLETLSFNDKNNVDTREREKDVFETLRAFFQSRNLKEAMNAMDSCNRDLEELFWWIESNMPNEFRSVKELAKAYEILSKADLFRSSIILNQNFRFKNYMKSMMAGIPLSRERPHKYFNFYKPPDRLVLLGMNKRFRSEEKEELKEIASQMHCSTKKIREQLPFLRIFMNM